MNSNNYPNFSIKISLKESEDCVILFVSGSINTANSKKLDNVIENAFEQKKSEGIFIDINGVDYIDSTGLATLIKTMKKAQEQHIGFALLGTLNPRLKLLLQTTRLDHYLPHYQTKDDAIQFINS